MNVTLDDLTGKDVRIVPMERNHIKGLYDIGQIKDIWKHLPKTIQTLNDMEFFVEETLENKKTVKNFHLLFYFLLLFYYRNAARS